MTISISIFIVMNNCPLKQPWALKRVWAVTGQNDTILPSTLERVRWSAHNCQAFFRLFVVRRRPWRPAHPQHAACSIRAVTRQKGTRATQPYSSCTCPCCHLHPSHNRQAGIHQCTSCGLMLHKKRELSLQQRKGRGLERSLWQ